MNPLLGLRVLEALPAVFARVHLEQRVPADQAAALLARWLDSAHVEALGARSEVYANRHMSAHPDWDAAVRIAAPSALIAGTEALRRAGWITQIPQRPEVVVRPAEAPQLKGVVRFEVLVRPDAWWAHLRRASPDTGSAASTVPPAWALADLLATSGWERCGVSPCDVSLDEASDDDRAQWLDACEALGLPSCDLDRLVSGPCGRGESTRTEPRAETIGSGMR